MPVVGRFAPTPSGNMHLGNVFSAMLSWLSARSQGGQWVLRLEDLDTERCTEEFSQQIKEDLHWLGLDWDREQTPQSRRSEAYLAVFQDLDRRGLLYPCYCSRAGLHAASAPHAADGRPIYAGICRGLTAEQRASQTKSPAWRLLVPDRAYSFTDGVQGPFSENLAAECGDFIIRRSDGVFAYQLAVVVDDIDAGVTEVVRGQDLLESTPRQLYLYDLLGAPAPEYFHVPLLFGPDGRRLSKRDRDLDLIALRRRMTPQQLLGRLAALAGLIPPGETASAQELAQVFSWQNVRRDDLVLQL